jgi:hypothetical protein
LPSTICNIGNFAFTTCTNLTNVVIPVRVTNLGNDVFAYCYNIRSASLPNSIKKIGDYSFIDCYRLSTVDIPDGVTNIGTFAFYACTNLNVVTIPASVSSIAGAAFYECSNLVTMYFTGDAPLASEFSFRDDSKLKIYYSSSSSGWSNGIFSVTALLWNPIIQTKTNTFGIKTNRFGFTITGLSGLPVVIWATTDLYYPNWQVIRTNLQTGGSSYFSDPTWTNSSAKFYRLSSP